MEIEMQRNGQPMTLERERRIMAWAVARGKSIQDAGRLLGVNRSRACKIWLRIRQDMGEQAV